MNTVFILDNLSEDRPLLDEDVMTFHTDVARVKQQGGNINYDHLATLNADMRKNEAIQSFLVQNGAAALPLVLVNDHIVLSGRYPKRYELLRWAGLGSAFQLDPHSNCGGIGNCC